MGRRSLGFLCPRERIAITGTQQRFSYLGPGDRRLHNCFIEQDAARVFFGVLFSFCFAVFLSRDLVRYKRLRTESSQYTGEVCGCPSEIFLSLFPFTKERCMGCCSSDTEIVVVAVP